MNRDVSLNDFGLLIAYLLPGFSALLGTSLTLGLLDWHLLLDERLTLAGVLAFALLSLVAGLAIGSLRWLLLDPLHRVTGVRPTVRDFGLLARNLDAYTFMNDSHYRYYEHNGGMLLAVLWVYACWRWAEPLRAFGLTDLGCLVLLAVYFLASRDTLRNFYQRTAELLSRANQVSVRPAEPPAPQPVNPASAPSA